MNFKGNFTYFLILALPIFVPTIVAAKIASQEIISGIEFGVQEEYDKAVKHFSELQQNHPTDPAPHFFIATLWQTRMMDFETQQWRDLFLSEIDTTIKLSQENLEQNPNSLSDRFYLGSAYSYKSFQLSREKRYVSALKLALKGMKQINSVIEQDSSFYNAYIGVGSYLYWRSYMTRKFSWLPFFADQRSKGRTLIKTSFDKGKISKWAALSNLAWIYIQEEKFEQAIHCAEIGLARFPSARTFLWPLGDAEYKNNNFDAALKTYQHLLTLVTNELFNNHYNEIMLELKIAHCYFALEMWQSARSHASQLLLITPDDEVKKRLESKQKQARQLIKKIDAIIKE